jgi:hypothetical protein
MIGKFGLINDGVLQVGYKLHRSIVINTFKSGNTCILDLVLCESESVGNDTDYNIWHLALGHPFIANVNQ